MGQERADDNPPTDAARRVAAASVRAAVRCDLIDLDDAETRLDRIYAATRAADVYAAVNGLPHPPAPLDLSGGEKEKKRWKW